MPRYRFPLQPVLKERKIREDQARMALAEQEAIVQRLKHRLAEARRLQEEYGERCAQALVSQASGSAFSLYHRYLERLKQEGARLLLHLRRETEALHFLRLTLQDRSRARRMVERLKENRYQRFLMELRAEEQKGLDDVAGIFHRRNRGRPETGD